MTRIFLLIACFTFTLPTYSCSIFTVAAAGEVLVGANEDGDDPFGKMWVMPPRQGRYGGIYFGLSFLEKQAGMNEHGLFFDYAALDPVDPDFNPAATYIYIEELLETCKTVAEALAFLDKHGYAINTAQLLLADASGASVIVTPKEIVHRNGNYQIATNFNVCHLEHKTSCRRYQRIEAGLQSTDSISVPMVRDLLDAVHVEGTNTTLYSKVFDLKRGVVYLYNFHNYGQPEIINLKDAFSEGFRITEIYDLFPEHNFAEELFRSRHDERLANTLYRHIRSEEANVRSLINQEREASKLVSDEFAQQLTKAIIEATIVERLRIDNYSPVYDFLPNKHDFYVKGWQSNAGVLKRCEQLLAYMQEEDLAFFHLGGGIPKEAGMGPLFAGYLKMVVK